MYLSSFPKSRISGNFDERFVCNDCSGFADMYMVHDFIWLEAWPTYTQERIMHRRSVKEALGIYEGRALSREEKLAVRAKTRCFVLCLHCLENRLGRDLALADFTEARINRGIRFGYALRGKER